MSSLGFSVWVVGNKDGDRKQPLAGAQHRPREAQRLLCLLPLPPSPTFNKTFSKFWWESTWSLCSPCTTQADPNRTPGLPHLLTHLCAQSLSLVASGTRRPVPRCCPTRSDGKLLHKRHRDGRGDLQNCKLVHVGAA